MKTKTYLFLTIVFVVVSCTDSKKRVLSQFKDVSPDKIAGNASPNEIKEGKNIRVSFKKIPSDERLLFSQCFESIEYLKLDNNPEAMIGTIDKIVLKHDSWYILDRNKTKSLKQFDKNGKYIMTIGQFGQGPKEQQEITDFFIGDEQIILYDQFKRKLFFYNMKGVFLYSKPTVFIFNAFYCFDPNQYIIHCWDSDNYHIPDLLGYSVLKTDSNFVVYTKGGYRQKDIYVNYLTNNSLNMLNDKLYFHAPLNDTIFSIDQNGNLSIDYILDFGKYKLPSELLLKMNKKRLDFASRGEDYAMTSTNYVPTNKYLYLSFSMKGYLYHTLYSNTTGIKKCSLHTLDDLYHIFGISDVMSCMGDTLIGYVQSGDLFDKYQTHSKEDWLEQTKNLEYVEFLDQLHYEDNPILVFYKIKEF